MKLIPTEQAVGHVLCHDITQIVRGVTKDAAFRKGHIVTEEDIPLLLSLGKENLYVWESKPGMLHENDAADILYRLCVGDKQDALLRPTPVKEGRIDVVAQCDGLLTVDTERLRAVNSLDGILVATRHTGSPVMCGDKLAGTRVIPLVIERERVDAALRVAGTAPLLRLHPYQHKRFAILTTGSEVYKGRVEDTFTPVIRDKLTDFPATELRHVVLDDDPDAIAAAITDSIDQGAELVICTGGMSVDPDDRTPLAIRKTGARIVSYGAPALPGAMFLLAYHKQAVIVGLPGCVMYAKRTIFDIILPRIMAGIPVAAEDLAALGHGGLCLSCKVCQFPACAFGAGV